MSETPRSSSRLAAGAVLLLCAGAGAWFYLNSGAEPQKTAVAVQAEAEKPSAVMQFEFAFFVPIFCAILQ